MADIEHILSGEITIHVFGYGSLTWKPDFEYDRCFVGYVRGYERRFWQGSTYHRGTVKNPGRCATLISVDDGITWGVVYEVSDHRKIAVALDYLNIREQQLGGYDVFVVPVYPRDPDSHNNKTMYSVLYIATPECKGFLGDDTYDRLAKNIAESCGEIGHNIEYLFRLTDWMRKELPDVEDEHLYTLDRKVRGLVGLDEESTEPWKELLKIPEFHNLVFPHKINFKLLWKEAILKQLSRKPSIDRWMLLLIHIDKMRSMKLHRMERVDFGDSLDIPDDDTKEIINHNNNVVANNDE